MRVPTVSCSYWMPNQGRYCKCKPWSNGYCARHQSLVSTVVQREPLLIDSLPATLPYQPWTHLYRGIPIGRADLVNILDICHMIVTDRLNRISASIGCKSTTADWYIIKHLIPDFEKSSRKVYKTIKRYRQDKYTQVEYYRYIYSTFESTLRSLSLILNIEIFLPKPLPLSRSTFTDIIVI